MFVTRNVVEEQACSGLQQELLSSCRTDARCQAVGANKARHSATHCPAEVVRERGAKRLRRELLVGFDPVPLFVALLERYFGHLAALFYDGCGGRAIGIRWRHIFVVCMACSCCATCLMTACQSVDAHDTSGASDVVAVQLCRWHPALRSAGRRPSVDFQLADARQNGMRAQPSTALELPAVLSQMYALGAGLVQDVLLCGSQMAPA